MFLRRQYHAFTTIYVDNYYRAYFLHQFSVYAVQSAPSVGTAISFENNIRDKTRLDGAANVWQAPHHIQAGRANV